MKRFKLTLAVLNCMKADTEGEELVGKMEVGRSGRANERAQKNCSQVLFPPAAKGDDEDGSLREHDIWAVWSSAQSSPMGDWGVKGYVD